ncbi:MAG: 16S rRNA (uracil(1498)-N(3))-methyltransferase [Actinobacteria bacterium]|nr:16S rRNA (uracil(1498)-N(3))-methyltransferase [Actinomycetota bacterium]
MSLPQFFVIDMIAADNGSVSCTLDEQEAHHLRVRRIGVGEHIVVADTSGTSFEIEVTDILDAALSGVLVRVLRHSQVPAVTLLCGISKGERMDLTIRACCELGVTTIVPVMTERCIVKFPDEARRNAKGERWRGIARAASKQSGQNRIPSVLDPTSFTKALELARDSELIICAWEEARDGSIRDVFSDHTHAASAALFIGPEGGFTRQEVEAMEGIGAKVVSLGETILRSETAAIVATALVVSELGGLGFAR